MIQTQFNSTASLISFPFFVLFLGSLFVALAPARDTTTSRIVLLLVLILLLCIVVGNRVRLKQIVQETCGSI